MQDAKYILNQGIESMKVLVTFKVESFDQWLDGFRRHQATRETANIRDLFVGRHGDDECAIVCLFEAPSEAAFHAFMDKPENVEAGRQAGHILESTTITMLEDVM